MGKVYDAIDTSLREFIQHQRMFFAATAPLSSSGLVNLSPKGLDSLRILDDHSVVYADLTGNGIETVAHVNGCGFTQLYPAVSSVAMRPIWFLNDLFVASEAKRLGGGRCLTQTATEFSAAIGAKQLVLATAVENRAAQLL